jgi:formiminoglutamase
MTVIWQDHYRHPRPGMYVFGVPEDLGAKGNLGIGGTVTLWIPFLQSFLNIQSNDFLDGAEILLLGHFDFGDIQYLIDTTAKSADEKLKPIDTP